MRFMYRSVIFIALKWACLKGVALAMFLILARRQSGNCVSGFVLVQISR